MANASAAARVTLFRDRVLSLANGRFDARHVLFQLRPRLFDIFIQLLWSVRCSVADMTLKLKQIQMNYEWKAWLKALELNSLLLCCHSLGLGIVRQFSKTNPRCSPSFHFIVHNRWNKQDRMIISIYSQFGQYDHDRKTNFKLNLMWCYTIKILVLSVKTYIT